MSKKLLPNSLAFGILLLLGVILIAPIFANVRLGFLEDGKFSTYWFSEVLSDPLYREGLLNSLWLASLCVVGCLLLTLPLVVLAEVFDFTGKTFWLVAIQIPLILPPFVGALGVKGILSRNGGLNALLAWLGLIDPAQPIDWLGNPFQTCVILESLYLMPIMFLNVQAAIANIDPALRESARDLGSSPLRVFFRVTLPLARPGLFAGATIVFIWAFTELGTPLIVGFRKLSAVQVFDALQTTSPEGDAYALVTVVLLVSIMCYGIGKMVLGRDVPAAAGRATIGSRPTHVRGWKVLLVTAPFAAVALAAVIPHIGVLLMSFSASGFLDLSGAGFTADHYRELLSGLGESSTSSASGMAVQGIINSVKYSTLAVAVDLVLGFSIAYLVVRHRNMLTKALDYLSMLPLAVPGLVMAFGYFAITQEGSPLAFLNPLENDPITLLVIAYAVRRLPFLVRSCAAGLSQVAVTLEEAAKDLGAGSVRTLWRVTIPLVGSSLIAGGLLVFSRSMLEVSDSLLLAFDRASYPMTKAIWALVSIPQDGIQTASALGVIGMLLLAISLIVAVALLGRRLGSLFRL